MESDTGKRGIVLAKSPGEVVRRTVSLGLTRQEAFGWYRNNVDDNLFMKSVITFALGMTLTFFNMIAGSFLQSTLTMHLVLQNFIFIIVGGFFAYAAHCIALSGIPIRDSMVYDSMLSKVSTVNRHGILFLVASGLLACYWGIPSNFDAATLGNFPNFMMHLTFICVGVLIFAGGIFMPGRVLTIFPVIVGKMLGLYGAFLILSPRYLYGVYPYFQQTESGVVMITIMVGIDMTIIPYWLYRYFSNAN